MGYETVAMESAGFYWKQLFVMLQDYGLDISEMPGTMASELSRKHSSSKARQPFR
jgi:hypothetical protein